MTRTRDERLAEYQSANANMAALQRVLLLGKDYAARRDLSVAQYATAGVTAAWPGLLAGEATDTATAVVRIEDAVLPIFTEAAGSPSAANGSIVDGDITCIWHNSGATVWAGTGRTVLADVVAGDYVRLVNGITTFNTTVAAVEYDQTTSAKVLRLTNSVPSSLYSGYFNITVAEVATRTVPAASLTLTTSQVTVAASLQLSSIRLGTVAVIPASNHAGDQLSRIVVDYRASRTNSPSMLATQTVYTSSQLAGLFVGYEYPESELGFAVAQSLSPVGSYTLAPPILCRAPVSYDDTGFTTAITAVTTDVTFSIMCPMSQSSTVITAARNMVTTRAAVTGRRHTHIFVSLPIAPGVSRGSEVTAFIASAAYNDENTVVVFPPKLFYNDATVLDTTATAIVAGLRSVVAHGLSIVDTALPAGFTHAVGYQAYVPYLDQLAAGGVTCLNEAAVEHARTTKLSNNLSLEEGMVALKNVVRRRFFQSVEGIIGTQRVSLALLDTVRVMVRAAGVEMVAVSYDIAGQPIWTVTVGNPTINGLVPTTIDVPITVYVSTTWFTGQLDVSISIAGE